ncbi:MAG: MoaD/ThiS family protein [Verrucomicrobiae bacterium]|nr:MoaD/ThiS family protein [Verrucomicrobiae bacterium]
MPRVRFTENIQRHVACPEKRVEGGTVAEVLNHYFRDEQERARGYVLDERGALRKHMAIFIEGEPIRDRTGLGDAVPEDGTVDVIQALSGG